MVEFIQIRLEIHKSHLINLNEEYLSWIADEMQQRYSIDTESLLGESIREYAKNSLEELSSYIPPEGIYYIIQIKSSIIGMGALRKLKKGIGEIKRMYISPKYRGNGYGKEMLELLLKKVYKLAGFQKRERYLESEVPTSFLPHWLFMEKFL